VSVLSSILQFTGVSHAALPSGPLHLAIGMFDGVHLGHRAVIEPALVAARRDHGVSAVLTFSPHPSVLFRPQDPTRLIQPLALKAEVLGRLGVHALITEPFTLEFARLPAAEFLGWLKASLPSLAAVYVGQNFRFGAQRKGDVALLKKCGAAAGVAVHSAAAVQAHGEWVSSTRIRAHLAAGEIEAANLLLGYAYFAEGVIAPGKRLGRTIGFPTLNLAWSPDLRPRFGVYAVTVTGAKTSAPLPAVANYGLRPTVENTTEPKLEVHVLGTCPYEAGDHITVEWLRWLRPEMKFPSIDELRAQIARDRDNATASFAQAARA
jgi:riboflavin kinase/FMN adenylyltransferase